jgi:purine nucleosidase
MTRKSVILDTDIGTNVDDAFAVVLALSAPELECKAITLVAGDLDVRSMCLVALLERLRRIDSRLRLARGRAEPSTPGKSFRWLGLEGRGIDLWSPELLRRIEDDGVGLMIEEAERPGGVSLIAIGALTNVADALRRDPGFVSHVNAIFCMGGSCTGLDGKAFAYENNFGVDPDAAEAVLASGVPVTVVGTNVTRKITLSRERRYALAESGCDLERLLWRMTANWLEGMDRDTVFLHDPVAVASAIDDSFLELQRARPVFEARAAARSGRVAWQRDESSPVRVATGINAARFWEIFQARTRSELDLARTARSLSA